MTQPARIPRASPAQPSHSGRITNADLLRLMQEMQRDIADVKSDVAGVQDQLAPIRRAWLDGQAGLKGAAWTLSSVGLVLGLWWSGIIQKALHFLGNTSPPGAP